MSSRDEVRINYADIVVVGNPTINLEGNQLIYKVSWNRNFHEHIEELQQQIKQLDSEQALNERVQEEKRKLLELLDKIQDSGKYKEEMVVVVNSLDSCIQPDYQRNRVEKEKKKQRMQDDIEKTQNTLQASKGSTYILNLKVGYRKILKNTRRGLPDSHIRDVFDKLSRRYRVRVLGVASGLSFLMDIQDIGSARSNLRDIKTELKRLVEWEVDWEDDLVPYEFDADVQVMVVGSSLPEVWDKLTSFEKSVEKTAISGSKMVGSFVGFVTRSEDIGERAAVGVYPILRGTVSTASTVMGYLNPFNH